MVKKQEPKSTPFKTVVQNLPFHNFEEEPKLIALFKEQTILGDDTGDETKTFTANVMTDCKTGEEKYVQNCYAIAKAIQKARAEYPGDTEIRNIVFEIIFLGKSVIAKGARQLNQFKIGYCTMEEFEAAGGFKE